MFNGSSFCSTQFNVVGFRSVRRNVCAPFLNELTGRDHDGGLIHAQRAVSKSGGGTKLAFFLPAGRPAGPTSSPLENVDFVTFFLVAKKGFFLALFSLKMINFLSLF